MSQEPQHERRSFSDELKRDSVNLIVNQGYAFRAMADAVGLGNSHGNRSPPVKKLQYVTGLAKSLRIPSLTEN